MKRTRTYRGPAKGFEASGNRKFCVAFEPDQFERINAHAKEANLTPAEAVRSLVCFAFDRLDAESVADAKQAAFRAEAKEPAGQCPTCKGSRQITVPLNPPRVAVTPYGEHLVHTAIRPCPDCAVPPAKPPEAT